MDLCKVTANNIRSENEQIKNITDIKDSFVKQSIEYAKD